MSAVSIDINTLNDLFDNQKKMDELFDSIFDDDNYFINSPSSSSQATSSGPSYDEENPILYGGESVKESHLAVRIQNPYYFILPIVLEIAAIYWVATNLL
ncbi:hypothetical protein [Methylomarinum vadi]|uniref:hypothetical protein n=1 Tax=Methylomarinum vadi TaxID=438855 RepID=UPI0004DF4830|nr:hypothetical protein [Methylomarinum vadi]